MSNGYYQMTVPLTPMVKRLIIITVSAWIGLQLILTNMVGLPVTGLFSLIPAKVIYEFHLWQPFTYIFLHSLQPFHILFNMLMLWFIGSELEGRWGSKYFLSYYLVSGIGAGIIYTLVLWIAALSSGSVGTFAVPVVGASGSIFGLLLAYGILFGERTIYFMMMFPMKAKYFVAILGGIQVISMFNPASSAGGVAYLAHIGGLISGFLYLYVWTRIKQKSWRKRASQKGKSRLKLVVDNEKDENEGPKYWN